MSAKVTNKELTRVKLWQGLLDNIDKQDEISSRDINAIRPIINFLFCDSWNKSGYMETSYKELVNDPLILGYIFSLQESKPFAYTWSHMRGKLGTYVDYLQNFQHYLDFVLNDINEIIKNLAMWEHVSLIVDGVFAIHLSENDPYFQFELYTDNVMGLLKIEKSRYSLRVRMNQSTIAVFDRCKRDTPIGIAECIDKFIVSAGIE